MTDLTLIAILAATAIGILVGAMWWIERQHRVIDAEFTDLEYQKQGLAEKMQTDDARLGIDHGKSYAVHKMRQTLDEIENGKP